MEVTEHNNANGIMHKGLDDLLAAGLKPTILRGDDARRYVAETLASARACAAERRLPGTDAVSKESPVDRSQRAAGANENESAAADKNSSQRDGQPVRRHRRRNRAAIGETLSLNLRDASGRTDASNAKRIMSRFGGDIHWCDPWQSFLTWDGKRWCADKERGGEAHAKTVAAEQWKTAVMAGKDGTDEDTLTAIINWARRSNSAGGVRDALTMLRSEPGVPIIPSKLDTGPWLLNVNNGTIDLRTGEIREHRREDLITQLAPVEYLHANEAECPTWTAFLDRIFGGKVSLIEFLQRLLGYCLTGRTTEQILPIFHGEGSNGKSTMLNVLLGMLGDYGTKAPPNLLMQKRGESHPTEKAALFAKRFIFDNESDQGRRLNESLVKDLSGSDTITARRMREDFWEFTPTHKIILATNHRPEVRGTDHAIWRRLRLVPFDVVIPKDECDKAMPDKLLAELPGILRWCVEGCLMWQWHGLGEPEEVLAATERYRQSEDQLGRFLAACCVLSENASVGSTVLLNAYREFTGDEGMNAKRFAMQMEKGHGHHNTRITSGPNKGRMGYESIGLLATSEG